MTKLTLTQIKEKIERNPLNVKKIKISKKNYFVIIFLRNLKIFRIILVEKKFGKIF